MIVRRSRDPQLERPVEKISPSLAERLESCELAVVFSLDPAYRDIAGRGNPFATLGEICHEVWEREVRGDFEGLSDEKLRDALEAAWQEAETRLVDRLRDSHGGAGVPPARSWPGYLQKRLGVLSLIKRSVRERRDRLAPSADVSARARPVAEEPIELPGVSLRGRPDRVVRRNGSAHIADLKTCEAGEVMTDGHRRQLLAYAYLWHARHGEWPSTATIQYVGGESRSIVIDPLEAEAVAAGMSVALGRLNTAVGEGRLVDSLATPSADTCRWCSFRAACAPFLDAVSAEWALYDRSLIGTVVEVEDDGRQSSIVLSGVRGNLDRSIETAVAIGLPANGGFCVGSVISIAGAEPTRSPSTVRYRWDTVVCVWPSLS